MEANRNLHEYYKLDQLLGQYVTDTQLNVLIIEEVLPLFKEAQTRKQERKLQ